MIKQIFVLLLGITVLKPTISQSVDNKYNTQRFFRFGYGHASIIATNDFFSTSNLRQKPITQQRNISLEVLFQSSGKKDWHQLINFPRLGIGFQQSWYPQTNELGSPWSVYTIFESTIYRSKRAYFDWLFHFGLTFNWNPYHPDINPNNVVIGTKTTIYAHMGVLYHHSINNRIGLEASIGMTHASNGAVKLPNYGINIVDPRIALTYNLNSSPQNPIHRKLKLFTAWNEIMLSVSTGTKQIDVSGGDSIAVDLYGGKSFTVYNIALLYQRQVSRLSKLGGGFDFTIDESDNANGRVYGNIQSVYPPPFPQKVKLSVILSYELCFGRLSLQAQPGLYIYRTSFDPKPAFYQRIGLRYEVYRGIVAGVSLRAINFGQADWVEFTLAYKIKF